MTFDDKIIDQKLQFDNTRETAEILALSSRKRDKYEYLTGEDKMGHVTFLMKSSYFAEFSQILMKFQYEITFDVKNYFFLLLHFSKKTYWK